MYILAGFEGQPELSRVFYDNGKNKRLSTLKFGWKPDELLYIFQRKYP